MLLAQTGAPNFRLQMYVMVYMLVNVFVSAYILGSMSLIVTKQEKEMGVYRDKMVRGHPSLHTTLPLHTYWRLVIHENTSAP